MNENVFHKISPDIFIDTFDPIYSKWPYQISKKTLMYLENAYWVLSLDFWFCLLLSVLIGKNATFLLKCPLVLNVGWFKIGIIPLGVLKVQAKR